MIINRDKAPAHHTLSLAEEMAKLRGPCVGCKNCRGVCRELMDLLILPDIILSKGQTA
jgi:formate hydrogenlyase subunit 6/NADH:ubiquinone oxidoreductase subunit I